MRGGIEHAAPQNIDPRGNNAIELSMKVGYQPPKAGAIRGVKLVATEQNGAESANPVPIRNCRGFFRCRRRATWKAGPCASRR